MQGAQVRSLVGELRSHMPRSQKKKKKKKKKEMYTYIKSLRRTPKTNTMLHVNYNSIKKGKGMAFGYRHTLPPTRELHVTSEGRD